MKEISAKLEGFLLMVLLCNAAAQLGCPASWVISDGNCFKVVFWGRDTSYNAEEADDHCKSLGGRIASIHSDEDFNALRGSWPNGCCLYYFGLKRNESRHWGYTDTTSYDYTNWGPDQENSPRGNCAGMSTSWVSITCSARLNGVICRKPIVDRKAPEAYCPNTTETVEVGSTAGLSVHFVEPTIYDEASPVRVTSSSKSPGALFYPGETRVVYTFEDPSHNVGSCVFYVIIEEVDTIPPTVSCSDFTSKIPLESSGTHVSFTEPVPFDNSGHVEIASQSHQPGDFFTEGETRVTYTYRDSSGNSKRCSFSVTVVRVDMTPPSVICNNHTVTVPLSSRGSNVFYTEPIASDNSGQVTMKSQSHQPGDFFAAGATEVTYTFNDESGNNAFCALFVIVERVDMTPPSVICNNYTVTVPLSSGGSNVSYTEPIASDNSGQVTMTSRSHQPGDFFAEGETEVTYTFSDEGGNIASCALFVTVERVDMTPPSVICNNHTVTVPLSSRGSNVSYTEPIASDNSGQVIMTSRSHQPGDFFAEGETEVTYTFSDESGNNASCAFYVIVERSDITPPKVVCHNFTETVPNVRQGSSVNFVEPIASDDSGHVFITSQSHYPGSFFAYGETVVTYNFSDVSKNNVTCSFSVAVSVREKNGEVEISKELEKILKTVEGKSLSTEIVYQTLGELSDLTSTSAKLTENNVDDIANILLVMSHFNTSSPQVMSFLLKVVDNLITSTLVGGDDGEILSASASKAILQSLERKLDNILRSGKNFSNSGQNIAVEVVQVENFDMPILFGSFPLAKEGMNEKLEASLVTDLSNDRREALTSIQLDPKALLEAFPQGQNTLPLSFVVHRSGILFQSSEIEKSRLELNSFIIAASTTENIQNLPPESLVVTKFRQKRKFDQDVTQCMFWNHSLNGSLGGWSEEGCYLAGEDNSVISCFCNHLTSFAILVNPYGDVKHGLVSTLSVIGCVISIVSLLLTVVSFLAIRTIRSKVPQKIIINLSFALLGLYLFFLVGVDRTELKIGCVIFGALIHFFLLASIAWMSVEATNMYLMFVKVLNAKVRHFLWKASLFAWVAPLVIAMISAVSSPMSYSTGNTCFPHYSSLIFYIAVFGLVVLLLIYNIFIFVLVTWKLTCGRKTISASAESQKETIRRLRNAFAISVLLGLTWTIGLLPVNDRILHLITSILFCCFNSLQGFLIFILFCLRHKEVQDAWKKWLHIPSNERETSTKSSIVSNQTNVKKIHSEKGSERLETVPSEDASVSSDRSRCTIETDKL